MFIRWQNYPPDNWLKAFNFQFITALFCCCCCCFWYCYCCCCCCCCCMDSCWVTKTTCRSIIITSLQIISHPFFFFFLFCFLLADHWQMLFWLPYNFIHILLSSNTVLQLLLLLILVKLFLLDQLIKQHFQLNTAA